MLTQEEILQAINEDKKLYLSKPIYEAIIRQKGGGFCSLWLDEYDNLDKAKVTTFPKYVQSGASKGGYFKIEKIQYINDNKFLPVKEFSEFIGSEKEFLLNNKVSVEEYEEELRKCNEMSYKIAHEVLKLDSKDKK